MKKSVYLSLMFLAAVACSKSGDSQGVSSLGSCDASQAENLTRMGHIPEDGFEKGVYQLESVSAIVNSGEDTVFADGKLDIDLTGSKTKMAMGVSLSCPQDGELKESVGDTSLIESYSFALTFSVDKKGHAILFDEFTVAELNFNFEGKKVSASVGNFQKLSADDVGLKNDRMSEAPGIKISEDNGNILIWQKYDDENFKGEWVARYKKLDKDEVPVATKIPPAKPIVITNPRLNKAQCLKKTSLNLGTLAESDIYFSSDCKNVYVTAGPLEFSLNGIAPMMTSDLKRDCDRVVATVGLSLSNSVLPQTRALQQANPNFKGHIQPNTSGSSKHALVFKKEFKDIKLLIPGLLNPVPNLPVGYDSVFMNGRVSGNIELRGNALCNLADDLVKFKAGNASAGQKVADQLLKDYDIHLEKGEP